MRNPHAFDAVHRRRDLRGKRFVDGLALANDEQPVVRRGVDSAIELGAMLRQRLARRDVEHELLDLREMRRERGEVLVRERGRA